MRPDSSFFRGSELPRLLILTGILVAGLVFAWRFARRPAPPREPLVVADSPAPVVPDRSMAFESVVDRTSMSLRDNAAYRLLLERARTKTPEQLAGESRQDILPTHLWERPEQYRGVPIYVDGTALRVLRYESKLSRTGWLYEAWVNIPGVRRMVYVCVFEDVPKGFPIGPNVSEHVVFNGYFLKLMKYEASDVARAAPLLVGRIGWNPEDSTAAAGEGSGSTLRWTLILVGIFFVISLVRWLYQLGRFFTRRDRSSSLGRALRTDEIDEDALQEWVRTASDEPERPSDQDGGPGAAAPSSGVPIVVTVAPGPAEEFVGAVSVSTPAGPPSDDAPPRPADSGTPAPDEAQSISSPPRVGREPAER